MSFRKQSGNMYEFTTHTWNVVKGQCEHDCQYCYMKRFGKLKPVRFDEKEMKRDLGSSNIIFVGSSNDIFSNNTPSEWIIKILQHCREYDSNKYLFQTKNPERFQEFLHLFPTNTILGTTIETNRDHQISKAPTPEERSKAMQKLFQLARLSRCNFERMVTIEPILDFDMPALYALIYQTHPHWVNIGADSQRHNLPEPTIEKINELIEILSTFTNVHIKRDLKRIFP
jgi:DNA repair photolyase